MSSLHTARGGRTALVVGASMAGLLAARVLAEHFDHVVLVERDTLPDRPMGRKGVPQGAHVHGIWPRGLDFIDRLLPGLKAALAAAGASVGDAGRDMNWHQFGSLKMRETAGVAVTMVSRPFLEHEVRQRVLAHPRVAIHQGAAVRGLATSEAGDHVVGAWLRRPGSADELLPADLVVDASGRAGQAAAWLAEIGRTGPAETRVRADVSYVTRAYERHGGDGSDRTIGHIVSPNPAYSRRGAAVFAVEGGRWLVTLIGYMGEQPPTDDAGFFDYASSLPLKAVRDIVGSARPLQAAASYRFPANLRRHYERLRQPLQGFVVMGDALASFNPAYGQGVTVATLQAQVLQDCLREGVPREQLAARYFTRAARAIDVPWMIATTEDLRYPQATGPRPLLLKPLNQHFTRVHHAAGVDAAVCRAFFGVAGLQNSPASMFTPWMLWRTFVGAWRFRAA